MIIDIDSLSPQERLELIARLWESLDADNPSLTAVQAAELDRRLGRADDDLADSVPWEALRTELAGRHR